MDSAGIINEIWRTITASVNYQVSNIGRVRNTATGSILAPWNNHGYLEVFLYDNGERRRRYIHRLVAKEFVDNPENKPCVDHINGDDKTNNSLSNIRWATRSENNMNTRKTSHSNSSRFKGVCWCKQRRKWISQIHKDKRKYHLGFFHDEKEAARAYNRRAMELFGEFAHLNCLSEDDDDDGEETRLSGDPLNTHYL